MKKHLLILTQITGWNMTRTRFKREIKLPVYGIVIELGEEPKITSDLIWEADCREKRKLGITVLHELILAHAVAGVDVESPAYLEGIEEAVSKLDEQLALYDMYYYNELKEKRFAVFKGVPRAELVEELNNALGYPVVATIEEAVAYDKGGFKVELVVE